MHAAGGCHRSSGPHLAAGRAGRRCIQATPMIGFRLGNQAGVKISALAANRAIVSVEDSKNTVPQPMNSGIPEYIRLWFIAVIII